MFTERKKSDRTQMATIIASIANEYGVVAEIKPEGSSSLFPRRVVIEIKAQRGLCINLDFDGKSCQYDIHVMSWYIDHRSDACLSGKFGMYGSLNQYHYSKATYIADGFDRLCYLLRRGLEMAQDGSAFDLEREAEQIAKDGTAAERNARWDEYFNSGRAAA